MRTGERAPQVVIKSVRLDCRAFPEAGRFVARCDSLRISEHGNTEREAFENLVETVRVFFESCIKRGTIERILDSRGILVSSWKSSTTTGKSEDLVVVPMPWMVLSPQHDGNSVY